MGDRETKRERERERERARRSEQRDKGKKGCLWGFSQLYRPHGSGCAPHFRSSTMTRNGVVERSYKSWFPTARHRINCFIEFRLGGSACLRIKHTKRREKEIKNISFALRIFKANVVFSPKGCD